jgi:hypothetical protein
VTSAIPESTLALRAQRRLGDWQEMRNIRCRTIDWEVSDEPPSVYVVTYRLHSFVDAATVRQEHHVSFTPGPDYPDTAPDVFILDRPPIFHPNVFPDGRICINPAAWSRDEGLGFVVLRVAKMLLYVPGVTNPSSAANPEAAAWYLYHRDLFPLQRHIRFPDPITGASPERRRQVQIRKPGR